MGSNYDLKSNDTAHKTTTLPTTLFSTKASKVQVRKSLSSPTNALPEPTSMIPSNTELPKKEIKQPIKTAAMPISPGPNKNKKRNQIPVRLNTKLSNINHFSSPNTTISSLSATTSTHERPHLRMSASSRFGKNLLPTWLGGHSTEEGGGSPTSSTHSNSSSTNLPITPTTPPASASSSCSAPSASNDGTDTSDLTNTFETLLVR
jgi:hypothetical protein